MLLMPPFVGAYAGQAAESAAVGIAVGVATALLFLALLVHMRRDATATARSLVNDSVRIDAGLDFDSLPQEWREPARECLSPLATKVPFFPVTVEIIDDQLILRKRSGRMFGGDDRPFSATVHLSSIAQVTAEPRGLGGHYVVFALADRTELRLLVNIRAQDIDQLVVRFQNAVRAVSRGASPGVGTLGITVTSPKPPPRTSGRREYAIRMACFGPWAVAMIGASGGWVAAIPTTLAILTVLALGTFRPVWMSKPLAVLAAVSAVAFAVDVAMTGEFWRVGGVLVSMAVGWWLVRGAPLGRWER